MTNQNGRGYKYEYTIREWTSVGQWQNLLNQLTNDGWQIEVHKISNNDWNGATIFRKVESVNVPLLEASIDTRHIYAVVNSTEMYNAKTAEEACKMICAKIKEVCTGQAERGQ